MDDRQRAHTWNRVGYYKDEPASHINTAQNVVTTQALAGTNLSSRLRERRGHGELLQFDAASRIATVWLNGTMLGTHREASRAFAWTARQH